MTTAGITDPRLAELTAIVGRDYVFDDASRLASFAPDGIAPCLLITPASAEEIGAVLRVANEFQLSVMPVGGGTRLNIGGIPDHIDIALSTARLNQIETYDPGDLTIGLAAGVTIAEVERLVASQHQVLPLDVDRAESATVGGVLASGDFGPLKHGFGGSREFCIGVQFVTGEGRHGKGGGRVVKNVAGYDMMKLLIGSYGTLGVITSANFKLFPAARQFCTFAAEFATLKETIDFRNRIVRSPLSPLALELVSPRAHEYLGFGACDRWTVLLRAGGSDAVLRRYRTELGTAIAREFIAAQDASLWNEVRNFRERMTSRHANAMLIEAHLPQSAVALACASAERVALDYNFLFVAVGRCASASMLFAFIPFSVHPPSAMEYVSAISALRAELPRDGAAIVARCPSEVKLHVGVWGQSANDLSAMRAVKQALDPKDVLNRGRFLF
jgi:glycolate oxidase FAD binding subunit